MRKAFEVADWRDETTVEFTTSEGPQIWKFGMNTGTRVVVDVLEQPVGDAFRKWPIPDPWGTTFQSRIFADPQHDLHVWIVPETPIDQLKHVQLVEICLFGPASIIDGRDATRQGMTNTLLQLAQDAVSPNSRPFLDFVPPQ